MEDTQKDDGKITETQQGEGDDKTPRRRFLKDAGMASVAVGLAHFVLLGRHTKVMAEVVGDCTPETDECENPSDPSTTTDDCDGGFTGVDPDSCGSAGTEAAGDQCDEESEDSCPGSMPAADECDPMEIGGSPDECWVVGGDTCRPHIGDPDVPGL